MQIDSIEIPAEFRLLCSDWAGGLDCMLRAIASTGGLTLGNMRPEGCDTPEKWYLHLWRDLSSDICHTLHQARRPDCATADDIQALGEFELWVNYQVARLELAYNLADWDN